MKQTVIHILMGKANPERMNGVNKVVHHLAIEQAALGHAVQIWGITTSPEAPTIERPLITELFMDHGKFRLDQKLREAIAELVGTRTTFHLHGGFIPQLALVAKVLHKNNLPYIYTPHGAHNTVALQRSGWKKKIYGLIFEKPLVKHSQLLHFIGASEVDGSRRAYGHHPFVLIPNGQASSQFIAPEIPKYHSPVPVFGTVGRLDLHTKGLDLLLQGFADLLHIYKRSGALWLVGDGPDRARVELLAQKLNIQDHVTFWGARFGAEKDELIAAMDLFCLTSRNEGLPGVVLEAASLGVPCLVSPETNMAEHIKLYQAGIALNSNTSDHITEGLRQACEGLASGELKLWGDHARHMVEEAFDWRSIADQHLQAYAA